MKLFFANGKLGNTQGNLCNIATHTRNVHSMTGRDENTIQSSDEDARRWEEEPLVEGPQRRAVHATLMLRGPQRHPQILNAPNKSWTDPNKTVNRKRNQTTSAKSGHDSTVCQKWCLKWSIPAPLGTIPLGPISTQNNSTQANHTWPNPVETHKTDFDSPAEEGQGKGKWVWENKASTHPHKTPQSFFRDKNRQKHDSITHVFHASTRTRHKDSGTSCTENTSTFAPSKGRRFNQDIVKDHAALHAFIALSTFVTKQPPTLKKDWL